MKRTIPMYERLLAGKTMNASVEERPAYRIAPTRKPESCEPRFGSRMASYLLVIELESVKRLDEFDVEWFEGELLRRLRDRVIAKPGVTEGEIGGYDLWAGNTTTAGRTWTARSSSAKPATRTSSRRSSRSCTAKKARPGRSQA